MASYRDELEAWAKANHSDGCSFPATQVFQVCCWEHDVAYRTGATLRGVPMTKAQTDQRFRDCLQTHSAFRWLSPLSWWRYAAVHWFGRGIWGATPVPLFSDEASEARRRILREFYA